MEESTKTNGERTTDELLLLEDKNKQGKGGHSVFDPVLLEFFHQEQSVVDHRVFSRSSKLNRLESCNLAPTTSEAINLPFLSFTVVPSTSPSFALEIAVLAHFCHVCFRQPLLLGCPRAIFTSLGKRQSMLS